MNEYADIVELQRGYYGPHSPPVGGGTFVGGPNAGDNLYLQSNPTETPGKIVIQNGHTIQFQTTAGSNSLMLDSPDSQAVRFVSQPVNAQCNVLLAPGLGGPSLAMGGTTSGAYIGGHSNDYGTLWFGQSGKAASVFGVNNAVATKDILGIYANAGQTARYLDIQKSDGTSPFYVQPIGLDAYGTGMVNIDCQNAPNNRPISIGNQGPGDTGIFFGNNGQLELGAGGGPIWGHRVTNSAMRFWQNGNAFSGNEPAFAFTTDVPTVPIVRVQLPASPTANGFEQKTAGGVTNFAVNAAGGVLASNLYSGGRVYISRSDQGGVPNSAAASIYYDTNNTFIFTDHGGGDGKLKASQFGGFNSGGDWFTFSSGQIHTNATSFVTESLFKVRQPGGTAGTDEVQISHDGTRGLIQSMDGPLFLNGSREAFGGYIISKGYHTWYFGASNWAGTGLGGVEISAYDARVVQGKYGRFAWSSDEYSTDLNGTVDTGFSRYAPNCAELNNGTAGSYSGTTFRAGNFTVPNQGFVNFRNAANTANAFQLWSYADDNVYADLTTGAFNFRNATAEIMKVQNAGGVIINSVGTGQVGVRTNLALGQTANANEIRDSLGNLLSGFLPNGSLYIADLGSNIRKISMGLINGDAGIYGTTNGGLFSLESNGIRAMWRSHSGWDFYAQNADLMLDAQNADVSIGGIGGNPLRASFDLDDTAGNTRLLLYDVDTDQLQRVKVGANGSGPGGGRALYLDAA